jgi:hypothetical protein
MIVNELPAQILPLFTDTEGRAFTDTVTVFGADTQPAPLLPVMVYVVFTVGDTTGVPEEKV